MIDGGRLRRTLAGAGLSIGLMLGSAQASAQSADALIEEGLTMRESGRDDEALERFERAYGLDPQPRTLAQIALAEQALGRWVTAEEHLQRALERADDPWIQQNRPVLEDALTAIGDRLGRLEVREGVPGAIVRIDGVDRGTLPLRAPLRVPAGDVVLEVRADGYRSLMRTVRVPAAGWARETITLVAAARDEATPIANASTRADYDRTGWWIAGSSTLAVGVAGLVVGAIFSVVRENAAAEWNDDARCLVGGATREENCGDRRTTANDAELASITGYVVGGALSATAIVLFVAGATARTSPSATAGSSFRCGGGPGEIGVACAHAF